MSPRPGTPSQPSPPATKYIVMGTSAGAASTQQVLWFSTKHSIRPCWQINTYRHLCPHFLPQVITISSSQSASPVTSTTSTSTLQPLVKLDPSSGAGMGASRPMQKYIVVSLPSSASSSLDTKSSALATSNSSTSLEQGMKLDRSESPGGNTQSPHWDFYTSWNFILITHWCSWTHEACLGWTERVTFRSGAMGEYLNFWLMGSKCDFVNMLMPNAIWALQSSNLCWLN